MNKFTKASFFMILSSISCIISDIFAKSLPEILIYDLLFFRFLFATIINIFLYPSKNFITLNNLIRGILFSLSMGFFLQGLKHLPLPFVILINFATPIFNTILSKLILNEKIKKSLIACIINTIGIFIACYSSITHDKYIHIASLLIAAMLFAWIDIFNKSSLNKNHEKINDIMLGSSFFSSIAFLPFISYTLPNYNNLKIIIGISLMALTIPYFMLKASQNANLSALQPLKYLEFPITLIVNYILFKDIISFETYIGFGIIFTNTLISYLKEPINIINT